MTIVTTGKSTWVDEAQPDRNFADSTWRRLRAGTNQRRWVYVKLPLADVSDQTVLSATLTMTAREATPACTITVQALAGGWDPTKVTWNNKPAVTGPTASVTIGALAAGAKIEIDIANLVQQVANGQTHYGWRIITTSTTSHAVHGFGSGIEDPWMLEYEVSEAPAKPTRLIPNGGVVSLAKWLVRTDFTDFGGKTTMGAIQVQVDPDQASPFAFDSGEVAATVPELDLATTLYAGLADAATTSYRTRVKDTAGFWSEWSDWATVTRIVKPTLTFTNPTGGLLHTPRPTVAATLSSGTVKSYQLTVARADSPGRLRYDSGRQPGSGTATVTHQVPFKHDGVVVFAEDVAHIITLRVWDRTDRQSGGPTDPPYIEQSVTVMFDVDGSQIAPATLTAVRVAGTPRVKLTWTRSITPNAWVLLRDDVRVAYPEDPPVATNTWEYVDAEADPNLEHTWKIKPITADKEGPASPTATLEFATTGVWVLSEHGDLRFINANTDNLQFTEKRATFRLPYRAGDVDQVGAFEGLNGTFDGELKATAADLAGKLAILRAIRRDPETPVRLVYGTLNLPVRLKQLSPTPAQHIQPDQDRLTQRIRFEVAQAGEYDRVV